jgi:hypothetical protein
MHKMYLDKDGKPWFVSDDMPPESKPPEAVSGKPE